MLQERGPTHELQVGVKGLRMKTLKVEEDVRAVRDEVEGRLGETLHSAEKHLCEVRSLLEQLTKSKSN